MHTVLRLAVAIAVLGGINTTPAGAYAPIVIPSPRPGVGSAKLALFVPGGKVPPQDYAPFLQTALEKSKVNMFGVIVHCGQLNLCDPLGQLDGLIADALKAAALANNGSAFSTEDIFVMGHSLGGVGARHYADTFDKTKGVAAFAGLALFGTQFNGDHEDFRGTLGYPESLADFKAPFLALLGELDMEPVSHAALMLNDYNTLSDFEKANKPVVVVPGMDHSQFCSPFNVSGDILPEISNSEALEHTSSILAQWVNVVSGVDDSGRSGTALRQWVENSTVPITSAWLTASGMERSQWCQKAQHIVAGGLPQAATDRIGSIRVIVPDGSANLEHGHTNFSLNQASGKLDLAIVSYAYYAQNKSWNPVDIFAPSYSSAKDISCKLVSADRIAQQLSVKGYYPQKSPSVTCAEVNEAAFEEAMYMLKTSWPSAVERFSRRGKSMHFTADSSTFAGPQWVFLSSLSFDVKSDSVVVSSPRLYSSITSKIYPGNFYCKVLSPAKAIEWIQTKSLKGRY